MNTGAYKRAWKWESLPDGARVYNAIPYAAVIESGRRAGSTSRPPTLGLTDWARRRLGLSREEARRAAFAIASAIRRRGLLPRRVLGNQLAQIEADLMAEVRDELAKELARP